MQQAKKVTYVPATNQQIGGGEEEFVPVSGTFVSNVEKKTDVIKSKIYDKIHRFIKIILKLAKNVGYDSDLQIKLSNGTYLKKSNIVDLLTHAMSVGKVLYGENEFIQLLADSNVDPSLIINDNVKLKLIQFKNKIKNVVQKKAEKRKIIYEKDLSEDDDDNDSPPRLKKRKIVDDKVISEDDSELSEPAFVPTTSKKRKLSDVNFSENEDSIDESQLDNKRWKFINE